MYKVFVASVCLWMLSGVAIFAQEESADEDMDVKESVVQEGEVPSEELKDIEKILESKDEIYAGGGVSYDPAGRRDPFVSLLRPAPEQVARIRPKGLPGVYINEVDIKGIFNWGGQWVAYIEVAGGEKSYIIRIGDKLFDGEVVEISKNEVVFKQRIEQPGSLKPFRIIRKALNRGKNEE